MKQQKKVLTHAQRKIERECKKMNTQEQKTLKEIKKLATAGRHDAAKIMAKDVSRMRAQQNQMLMMSSQLKSMTMQLTNSQTQKTIMTALQGSTQVMNQINADMDVSAISNVLKEFNKELGKQEMKQDMVNDAFEMMEDPGQQADAEDVYDGIMNELQLEYTIGQPAVPTKNLAKPQIEEEK